MEIVTESRTQHRDDLARRYREVRGRTESLVAPLSSEAMMISATPETSPAKWHLAHTTWFFERFVLRVFQDAYVPYREEYDYLFNSYYRAFGGFLPKSSRPLLASPSLDEVERYRKTIDERILDVLERSSNAELERLIRWIELGTHHEEQHQELLMMDLLRAYRELPDRPAYLIPRVSRATQTAASSTDWIVFDGGLHEIGARDEGFAFDHERPRHRAWIEPFALACSPVTEAEFADFIADGGYREPRWWLSDGWDWIQSQKIAHPLYWEPADHGWMVMSLEGERALDTHRPMVHVSYYEAAAYAQWRESRLPTESEWELAASRERGEGIFLEDTLGESRDKVPEADCFRHLHGTGWEWTASAYLPYPGFHPLPGAAHEYNEKFMINQMVLRGGSYLTPRTHYRTTYRNYYYPWMRWQPAGIRLARDL